MDDKIVWLDILDTAGQEEFDSMKHQWIREGDGYLLVYNITCPNSFFEIQQLREHILQSKPEYEKTERAPIVIAGNKCDLAEHRKVSKEEGQKLADEWECPFFETSALTRINDAEIFYQAVREVQRYQRKATPDPEVKDKKPKWQKCVIL